MTNLKEYFGKYLWLIIFIGILLFGAGVFWVSGKYIEHKTDSAITETHTAANTAMTEAQTDEANAANVSIERRTEDSIREKTIRPKLETARQNSKTSQVELEKARQQFNEKTNPRDANGTWADNCARLKRVFPDTTFDYCQ
jgi:hypothetical protein